MIRPQSWTSWGAGSEALNSGFWPKRRWMVEVRDPPWSMGRLASKAAWVQILVPLEQTFSRLWKHLLLVHRVGAGSEVFSAPVLFYFWLNSFLCSFQPRSAAVEHKAANKQTKHAAVMESGSVADSTAPSLVFLFPSSLCHIRSFKVLVRIISIFEVSHSHPGTDFPHARLLPDFVICFSFLQRARRLFIFLSLGFIDSFANLLEFTTEFIGASTSTWSWSSLRAASLEQGSFFFFQRKINFLQLPTCFCGFQFTSFVFFPTFFWSQTCSNP